MDLASEHIHLMDTTLRDGEQTQGVSFTPSEKMNIAKALLQRVGVDRLEIASARISQGEQEAVQNIAGCANNQGFLDRVEVLGFCDHDRSVDWIFDSGARVMNLLTKGSENHCNSQCICDHRAPTTIKETPLPETLLRHRHEWSS